MIYDDLPTKEWFIFDGATDNVIGLIPAIDEDDALEIAAGTFFDYPATQMYAVSSNEF